MHNIAKTIRADSQRVATVNTPHRNPKIFAGWIADLNAYAFVATITNSGELFEVHSKSR